MRNVGYLVKAVAVAAAFGLVGPVVAEGISPYGPGRISYKVLSSLNATSLAAAEQCGWEGGDDVARQMAAFLKKDLNLTPQAEKTLLLELRADGLDYASYEEFFMAIVKEYRTRITDIAEDINCDRRYFKTYNQVVGWTAEPAEGDPFEADQHEDHTETEGEPLMPRLMESIQRGGTADGE